MSWICNVESADVHGEMNKAEVRDEFTTAGQEMLRAGASLFSGLAHVETLDFQDGVPEFEECIDRLDTTIEHLQNAIDMTLESLPLEDEAAEYFASFDYESLRARASVESLFIEDEEAWDVLMKNASQANVLAGPRMYLSMLTELRAELQQLVTDIDDGHGDDHLIRLTWSIVTSFQRSVNLGTMLSYFNRETRNPAGTGKAPSKTTMKAGESLIDG